MMSNDRFELEMLYFLGPYTQSDGYPGPYTASGHPYWLTACLGSSEAEAVELWESSFADYMINKQPSIVWRVRPTLIMDQDFETDTVLFKVRSRSWSPDVL